MGGLSSSRIKFCPNKKLKKAQRKRDMSSNDSYLLLFRGVVFHVGVIVVTLPFIAMVNSSMFLLTFDRLLRNNKNNSLSEKSGSVLRRLFHTSATFVFANWSLCVGRLLVWCYGMRCYASKILPQRGDVAGAGTAVVQSSMADIAKVLTAPPAGKVSVVTMNHRTVLDWMFLWAAIAECEDADLQFALKIVPKAALSKLPLFGWAMQAFRFLFLSRKSTESDCSTITHAAHAYVAEPNSADFGPSILIFPEGTDLSKVHLEKSQEYCKKNNLPLFNYVLAPRGLGLGTMLQAIGKDNLGVLLDITLGYEDFELGERPTESSCLKGRAPRAMHLSLRQYCCALGSKSSSSSSGNNVAGDKGNVAAAKLLRSGEAFVLPPEIFDETINQQTLPKTVLNEWVWQLFGEKEKMLESFYARQQRPRDQTTGPADPATADISVPVFGMKGQNACRFGSKVQLKVSSVMAILQRILVPFFLVVVAWWWVFFMATALELQLTALALFLPFLVCRYIIFKKPIHEYLLEP